MSRNHPTRPPEGHVSVTAAAIGSMALVFAVGLRTLGFCARADTAISAVLRESLQPQGSAGFTKALPEWGLWLATAVVAYGITFAMLGVPGTWRRVVLWLSALVLVAGWAPVLALAAHEPQVTAPLVAVLWSGLCSLVYARSHRMPCEDTPPSTR